MILSSLFDPKSIALIGASDRDGSVGRIILKNLLDSQGRKIFPVNPHKEKVLGHDCYHNVGSIPEHVDMAVIATPIGGVPQIMEECGKAGVRGAVIISSGFKETRTERVLLEKRISDMGKQYGMRILGPDSLGFVRPNARINTTFLETSPPTGNIAFISQSGALGSAILDWAADAHVGFSMFASLGSMIDIGFGDLIDFLGNDWSTKSILIYMEEVGDARKFLSAARAFALHKPIIVLKPGRIAMETTADEDAVYEAAFKRVGVVRARGIADLFHAAAVLDSRKLPGGPRLAIVTAASQEFSYAGPGVMATDALINPGGELAELSPETIEVLNHVLPPYCNKSNPIDVLGTANNAGYVKVIDACLKDPQVDGVLVIYVPMNVADSEDVARTVIDRANRSWKPVITAWMGGRQVRNAREMLIRNNVPTYETPEEAVRTYVNMYKYRRNLDLLYETPSELPEQKTSRKTTLKEIIRKAALEGRTVLLEEESEDFLLSYGIPSVSRLQTVDHELVLRSKKSKDFGTVILFGRAGTAGLVPDFSIGLPPLNQTLAKRLVEDSNAFKLGENYRSKTPTSLEDLEETLVGFSNLIVDFPEIAEISIDPLALTNGKPYAINARIMFETEPLDHPSKYPHLVITPYPIKLVTNWKLADGTEVVLKPIKPEDEPLERELLSSLSEETLRTRFLSFFSITHERLVFFCNIDYDRELAIVAEITEDGRRRMIGVGRLLVDPDKNSAEYALLVHDSFQGRGLGCKLMQTLIESAREKGLEEISAEVLSENKKMLGLAGRLGLKRKWLEGGIIGTSLRLK